jgi:hypothetical protein
MKIIRYRVKNDYFTNYAKARRAARILRTHCYRLTYTEMLDCLSKRKIF